MATRELYDLDAFKTKALAAIERIKSQPIEKKKGPVGKVDVLNEVKKEILELIDAGYTITQIREVFERDVFKILPKTITEIIKQARKEKEDAIKAERKAAAASAQPAPEPAAEQKPKTARKAKTVTVTEPVTVPVEPPQAQNDGATFEPKKDPF